MSVSGLILRREETTEAGIAENWGRVASDVERSPTRRGPGRCKKSMCRARPRATLWAVANSRRETRYCEDGRVRDEKGIRNVAGKWKREYSGNLLH